MVKELQSLKLYNIKIPNITDFMGSKYVDYIPYSFQVR